MNFLKVVRVCGVVFLLVSMGWASHAQTTVNWLTWEEAIEKSKVEKRKFLVDVYTDWCGYCKKMDRSTFQNAAVADYVNANFYPIKFNAEMKGDIELNDKTYKLKKQGTSVYHELALEITYGKLSYPTFVFMDENAKVIQPIAGFKDAKIFKVISTYFAEDHFKTTPWKTFYARNGG